MCPWVYFHVGEGVCLDAFVQVWLYTLVYNLVHLCVCVCVHPCAG
jgi:hypothetical protein